MLHEQEKQQRSFEIIINLPEWQSSIQEIKKSYAWNWSMFFRGARRISQAAKVLEHNQQTLRGMAHHMGMICLLEPVETSFFSDSFERHAFSTIVSNSFQNLNLEEVTPLSKDLQASDGIRQAKTDTEKQQYIEKLTSRGLPLSGVENWFNLMETAGSHIAFLLISNPETDNPVSILVNKLHDVEAARQNLIISNPNFLPILSEVRREIYRESSS